VRVRLAAPQPAVERALVAAGAMLVDTDPHLTVGGSDLAGDWTVAMGGSGGPPTLGPFLARRDHPITADLDGTGTLWSGGAERAPGAPLLVADGRILISADPRRVRLHLDPATSTVARHPLWPGLWANLIAWRQRHLPGPSDNNPRCGQPFTAVLPGADAGTLTAPDGTARTLHADALGTLAIGGLPQPGLWRLSSGSQTWAISALPLDARQADFTDAATASVAAEAGTSTVARSRGTLAHLLPLVLAALAACGAWLAFRREDAA
jgi:hypothetical protein